MAGWQRAAIAVSKARPGQAGPADLFALVYCLFKQTVRQRDSGSAQTNKQGLTDNGKLMSH